MSYILNLDKIQIIYSSMIHTLIVLLPHGT